VLVPSLFRREAPPVFSPQVHTEGPAVLFFPVPVEPLQAAAIWRPAEPTHRALVALLGQTRADVLAMIAHRPVNGTELANRLGIAPASVSEHATVLRDAGLTTRSRVGNTVLHSITSMGTALLNGVAPDLRPEPKVVDPAVT
jgi:DNA-binding transcriptional ArsR family regulator